MAIKTFRLVLPCPFCGEEDDLGIGQGTKDREGIPTYVYCGACGVQGPWKYTQDEAVQTQLLLCADETGWNSRHNNTEEHEYLT